MSSSEVDRDRAVDGLMFVPFMAFGVENFPSILRHCAQQAEKLLMAAAQEEHDDGI